MNPYPKRLEELHLHLEHTWGHKDRQATEILLAAMLPEDLVGLRRPWFIIETDWNSIDTTRAWFTFGGLSRPVSMSRARILRSQACEQVIAQWIGDRMRGIESHLVESEWRKMAGSYNPKLRTSWHSYLTLLAQCIRLRVEMPLGGWAMRTSGQWKADEQETNRLATRVLDNSWRTPAPSGVNAVSWKTARSLLYWCEMLQKLAPLQTNWEALVAGLSFTAIAIGRLKVEPADGPAAERLMRDMVHPVTEQVLRETMLSREEGKKASLQARKRADRAGDIGEEVKRLAKEGVIVPRQNWKERDPYHWHPWRYRVGNSDWRDLIDREKRILV